MSSPSPLASLSGPEACTRTIAYYNSADAGEVISKDIDQLRKNIVIINGLFDKVMRPLQAFDHKHAKSSKSEGALAPQWADFRTVCSICLCLARHTRVTINPSTAIQQVRRQKP